MAHIKTEALLSFTTQTVLSAHRIAINETTYPLRTKNHLTVSQSIRYGTLYNRLVELYPLVQAGVIGGAPLTAEQDVELEQVLTALCELAVDAPRELVGALLPEAKMAIVSAAFFGLLPAPSQPAKGAKRKSRTGTGSSRV